MCAQTWSSDPNYSDICVQFFPFSTEKKVSKIVKNKANDDSLSVSSKEYLRAANNTTQQRKGTFSDNGERYSSKTGYTVSIICSLLIRICLCCWIFLISHQIVGRNKLRVYLLTEPICGLFPPFQPREEFQICRFSKKRGERIRSRQPNRSKSPSRTFQFSVSSFSPSLSLS